jgi:TRAP-type C4-dicarboxylate transport system substrate-binding protein
MQYIWGKRDIRSLDELKGAKLRIASPEQGEFVRRFGGSSVTMGASEVPSALDRGVVDGVVTGSVGADLWKDLMNRGYLMGLNFNNAYVIANAAAFEQLSPEVQQKVREQAGLATSWATDTMKGEDSEIIKRLGTTGGFQITEPTKQDVDRAVAEMTPFWESWAKSRGPKVEEALAKVRAAVGR